MFEGLVHQLLVGYLGNYVKDIHKDQFRIGLWKGEVLLENVELVLEAFDYLQLPFAIKKGVIGKLSIKIPWKKLGWDPILIALEDVYVCTCRRDDSEWSVGAVEARELAGKKANLAAAELAKLSRRVSDNQAGQSFISYLSAKIIDNIQVTIQNVHIRYVDQNPDSRVIFSLGLRFSTLMITTSDVNSAGGRLKGGQVNKLLQIHDMGLYWNSREIYSNEVATEDMHGVQSSSDTTLDDGEFNYILKPLSATLSLMVSKSGRFESGTPQYAVNLDLNDLVLTMDGIQIYQMLMLWDYVSVCRLREKYGRFRPWTQYILARTGVGWQRMWWRYAINAVLADVRRKLRRTSWIYFGSRLNARRKYIKLYRLKLERLQQDQHLDDASFHELEEMEKELEMDEILNYRSLAECQLQLVDLCPMANGHDSESDSKDSMLEKQHSGEQTSNKPRGWLNWLSLGMLGAGGTTDSSQFAGVISDEVIKDIYEATEYNPASSLESGMVSKGHSYLLSIGINARQVIVTLNSTRKKVAIICMTIHGANLNSNFWKDSASASIILNSLEVVNPSSDYLPFSFVLRNKDNVCSDGFLLSEAPSCNSYKEFVTIEIEMLPQSSNFDFSVRAIIQPFEFVYDVNLLENLSEFFGVLASFQSHLDLVLSSLNGFENNEARVLSKAEYIFSNRKSVSFEANFQNAVFIFPWCSAHCNWSRMVFSMKSMHFVSVVGEGVSTQKFKNGQFYSSSKNMLYNTKAVQDDDLSMLEAFNDRFELKLSGVQGKLETPNTLSNVAFIQAFDAKITVDRCVLQDELAMNQLKVHGVLPSIHFLLSSSVCNALKEFSTNHWLKPDDFKREQMTVRLNNVSHDCKVREGSSFGSIGVDNLSTDQPGISLNSKKSTTNMLSVVRYKVMLELKSLSIELCLDDGDETCQEKLTLHAQIENMNVESVQGACGCKLGIGMETINVEVPNVVGSPAYSILCTKKILSTGSSTIRVDDNFASMPISSLSNKELKSGLEGKFVCFLCQHIQQTDCVTATIKVSLNNLECRCHPKVIGTLHRFFCDVIFEESMLSGVRTVDNAPVMEVGKAETAQQSVPNIKCPKVVISRLDDFSKNLGISSDQYPFVCFKNGLSKNHDKSCTIDSANDEKDASVFDKTVKTEDGAAYTKLSGDIEPNNLGTTTVMDVNSGINESDASDKYTFKIDLEVDSTDIHFHDSACVLATVVIPKSKSFVFLSKENALWDVMIYFEGVRLLSLWAPATLGEVLWGPLFHGPCPIVNLRILKKEKINGCSELEMSVSIQHICCILPSDFLAVVIGYFAFSHWEKYLQTESDLSKSKEILTSENTSSHFHCKVEVIDSVLILPVETSCNEFLELGLPELFFTLLPSCTIPYKNGNLNNESTPAVYLSASKMDFIDVAGRQLSLSFASTRNDGPKLYGKDSCLASAKLPLIERLDADLSLRIPCDVKGSSHYPFVPTSIVFNCQSFEANVLEKCFLTGVLAIEDVVLKLSTVNTISKLFVSSVSQFRESIVEFKYSKTIKSEVPPAHSVDVKFFMSNVLLKLHTSREEAVDVLELIGKVDARRLKVSGFWRNESLEALALEILSLDVISCSNSVTLLNCISEESSHPGIDVHLCTLDTGISEASISVPRIDIWLHLSAWSELVVFAITCIQSPSRTEYVSLGSSQTGFTDTGEFNDVVQPYSRRSDGSDIRPRHFCLKSETLNVYIHIPDYSSEDNVGVSAKEHGNQQGLYQHDSSVNLDDREKHFMGPGSPFYKFLSFSLSIYLDEVILLDGKWIFKARIVQIQGKTENFQEQCVHCLPFCHIADIELEGKAWDECAQLQKLILSIQMDTVDLWCSYPILSFWHNFNFEQSKKTSSMASAFSLDVCIGIHKAAFLLSDGRWSCNAPIMEIFVRHIHFRANWRNGTLESSISLEVQMNYHNIHKVTWEPFLEPWSLQCHLIRNFGCNGLLSTSPMTNIHIDSLSQLNLNLTEALMQAAVRGNEMIKDMLDGFRSDDCPGNHQVEEYSPLGNAHVRRYAPYFLQNDTGMLLYFWLIRGPTIVENNEILDRAVRSSVEPGCAMPLFVEETPEELFQRRRPNQSSERLVDRKSSGSRHHMICIQLEGTSRASMPMSMDLVGLRSLEVDFSKTFGTRQRYQEQDPPAGIGIQETINKAYSNSKFVVPVILEVSTQRYSKLVRLYSTVTLVNATCVSLEVRFDIPFGIAPKVMDPILPGQELALPVHLAETGRIRYRPLGSSYLWSEAQSLTNVLSQDNRHGLLRSFACYPSHPTDGPFRCCISVRESTVPCYSGMKQYSFDFQDQNSGNNLNDNETTGSSVSVAETKASFIRQIRLTAPLVLKNCLPVTLAFSIENGAGVAVNIFASEGDAVSVFEIDSAHELGIAFHIAGFAPSFVKFPRSAMYDTELGKVNSDAGKILITETLILNPDSSKGLPVSIKVEKALDAFCGSRELCLSVPFWLYNCSGLTLEAMDGDMDEQVDHRVVYSSYSDMRQEQLMNPKSGMAIACADLLSTIDNDVTYRRGIHWENSDVPCKIWNHLPSRKIISNRVLAHGSTSESSGYFEDNSLGILGFSSFNGSDRWPRKGGNMSFSNCEGGKIEAGGKGIDQIPKFHNTCMHSPAKGLQTSEATLRLRISQSKYVEDAMEGSAWSHPFSLNPPNGSTPVLIPYPFSTGAVIISAIRTPVLGACAGKTTAITFQPSGLTLEHMDGDMDEQVDHKVVYSSCSDMKQEQLMNAKSGMAIACADLLSTIDNHVTYRRGIHWENHDMPCKIWNHLPSCEIISNCVLAHGSISRSSGYFEDTSLGISGFSSFNGSDRWPRKGVNMSFSNFEGGKIEVGGKGIDQIPKFHNTCMHSPAKELQTSEATLRLRISQSKYVEDAMEGSFWSLPFSLNSPNGSTPVLIPYPVSTGAVIISAIRTPVLGDCAGKTTAITFLSRYVISNACSRDLCYRQRGTDSFRRLRVGEHFNLHWTDVKREFLVCVRFDEPGWDWSGSFHPDQLGDTLVKLRNYVTGALQMVRVEVQNASAAVGDVKSVDNSDGSLGTYLILLSDDDTGFMPYRIDNFSMERLRFYQQKCEKFENIVQPYACCSYAWDEPSYPHRLVIEVPGEGLVGSYSLDDVRDYTPVHLSATPDKSERRFSISVHAEGPIKVLSITSEHMHISKPSNAQGLHKFGERNTATGQIKDNCMDLSEKITVCLPFIGLSIIDSVPQELAFACARGIKIQILQGLHQQKLILQVASVQFDNQLPHPIYPVMVCNENASSGPLSFQGKAKDNNLERAADVICEASPDIAFFISAVKWRHMATSVVCFESVTVRVAALRLEFEEHMILRLVDFVKSLSWRFWKGSTQEQNSDMWILKYGIGQVNTSSTDVRNFEFVKNPHSSQLHFLKVMKVMESYKSEPSPAAVMPIAAPWQQIFLLARRRRKIYVEIFHIAPMKLTISFSSTPWLPKDDRKAATQSLMWISSTTLQRGLLALMDVEGAPIYFRQLTLAHPLASWDAIQGMVVRHYTRQLLHEVYKVLGSVGVFGNPMGFARSLGFGIRDFISVPAKSIVQNPGGIVTGMAQGTRSLLNNTVFAVSNAAAQFSKAARKGVVAFAFDEEFVAEIERRQQGQGSHNQGVLNDFLEGLTGLLQSPIRGAEKHGLPGILSGIAVGAAGLIARPVVSILEVSGRTAQSIRNRSNPSQLNHFRVRFPRPLVRDSPLLPYSWEEAVGTAVLQEVESKRLKDEVLVTCIALGFPGLFIVLTERLLLKVKSACIAAAASPENNMPGGPDWSIQQEISLDNIIHVDRKGQLLNVLAGSQETYFRRRKDPTTSKKNYMSHFVPFTQETIVLPHEDAAKELSQLLGSLLDELKKHSSPSILRRENLRSVR